MKTAPINIAAIIHHERVRATSSLILVFGDSFFTRKRAMLAVTSKQIIRVITIINSSLSVGNNLSNSCFISLRCLCET